MQPIITPEEAHRLDAETAVADDDLMERAGLAVAIAAVEMGAGYGRRVVVLAGPGNNGGDGYVAARHLQRRGASVEIRSLGFPKGEESAARKAAVRATRAGVPVRPLSYDEPADLVIDALFGIGFHGRLVEPAVSWTGHPAPVLAVDIASGLSASTGQVEGPAFRATRTVTFHARKLGHVVGVGAAHSGEVTVADIGLVGGRPALKLCEFADAPLPPRKHDDHKWSVGSVMVVGGSPGLTGAALLAAQAALRFGAGAVRIACPWALQPLYAAMDPSIMTIGIGSGERFGDGAAAQILVAAARYDAMVVGPGLGDDQDVLVRQLLAGWDKPLVLDADGLNAADRDDLAVRDAPTVLTPHHGEFSRLTDREPHYLAAAEFAESSASVVVLKGGPTAILGDDRWVVTEGGPELATIGTGDVLAGMSGSLIARGLEPEVAARSAVFHHGRAGHRVAARQTLTASRLVEAIGGPGS